METRPLAAIPTPRIRRAAQAANVAWRCHGATKGEGQEHLWVSGLWVRSVCLSVCLCVVPCLCPSFFCLSLLPFLFLPPSPFFLFLPVSSPLLFSFLPPLPLCFLPLSFFVPFSSTDFSIPALRIIGRLLSLRWRGAQPSMILSCCYYKLAQGTFSHSNNGIQQNLANGPFCFFPYFTDD